MHARIPVLMHARMNLFVECALAVVARGRVNVCAYACMNLVAKCALPIIAQLVRIGLCPCMRVFLYACMRA
jgi:hypothetical protein